MDYRYLPIADHGVLVLSPAGVGEVRDFMPLGEHQRLIRRVVCVRGEMPSGLECEPRFNYDRDRHEVVLTEEGALFRSPELSLALGAPTPITYGTHVALISAAFSLDRKLD